MIWYYIFMFQLCISKQIITFLLYQVQQNRYKKIYTYSVSLKIRKLEHERIVFSIIFEEGKNL